MGEMRRIEIEIDAAMLAAADDAVENGRFADRDAVIGHALALWSDDVNRVRRMIDAGFASGDPLPGNFDAEDIKRRRASATGRTPRRLSRMDIIRRPSAQADVDDLWTHIATMDVAAADRTVDRIVTATERLRRFRRSGAGTP